jgi:hypothetical protein
VEEGKGFCSRGDAGRWGGGTWAVARASSSEASVRTVVEDRAAEESEAGRYLRGRRVWGM